MAGNDVLRRDGVLARITGFDEGRVAYYAVMPNGHTTQLTFPRQEVFDVGDVLLVGEDFYTKVPADVWPVKPRVGIVRRALDDCVVLETSDGLELLEGDYPLNIMPGNTVEFTDLFGIERVLWPTAIRPGESDHDDDIKQYRITPGADPTLTFDSFGGYEQVITRAKELIETQLGNSEQMRAIGAKPIKGVIFTGAPGTGKTHLARIIANVADAQFYLVSGPTIVSKYVGDSEETLRMIFAAAQADRRAIIFFDEIDSIASSRDTDTNGVGKRLVAQLLTLMDGFASKGNVVVVAATNRIEDVDPALLRPGRFDWQIPFPMPSEHDRLSILEVQARALATEGELPLADIARRTEGWSGAEVCAIWTEAALVAAKDRRGAIRAADLATAFARVERRPELHAHRMP
ncbi:ATPase AAA [Bifidobacterium sp. UTCIF-37]|uniref:26S protease regulatory subunit n=1 Tax=Bifidobacterium callitrichos TaxID=762209 RepID=A0A5M9ZF12_9BIFI|nr:MULTISPECIES: AAA family ATPase [Bifidobacterium]KAA8817535.1 26S protease regulatory subunit [Bifidobacterium callitrichos]TPF86153.1 ATPase AAA [Bifidobacterium sp. UTCIF-37]TPF88485.1 ATPase AAA [Bifidobacterium sp. UTCIF-38]